MTLVQHQCQTDTHKRPNSQNGGTGGPKLNSSWLSWERSLDLGTYGGSHTCATETVEVSVLQTTATAVDQFARSSDILILDTSELKILFLFLQACSSFLISCSCSHVVSPYSSLRLPSDNTLARGESRAGERFALFSKVFFLNIYIFQLFNLFDNVFVRNNLHMICHDRIFSVSSACVITHKLRPVCVAPSLKFLFFLIVFRNGLC